MQGLINAIVSLAPHAEHRHCARHVYANWRKNWSGKKYKDLFWKAVKSSTEMQFKDVMEELKKESVLAYEDFCEQEPRTFCKSLIQGLTKTDVVDNNICETFNSYILKFRDEPLIDMLDGIRLHLMTRMRAISESICFSNDILCPNVRMRVEKMQSMVNNWTVMAAVGRLFEVHNDGDGDRYIVNLPNRECDCRLWKLTGLPCCHALACINYVRDDVANYIDIFYHKTTCIETYKHALKPFPDQRHWPIVNEPPILPPKFVLRAGRPKKARRRDPSEDPKNKKWSKIGVKMTCRACGQFGHNISTCSAILPSQTMQPKPKVKTIFSILICILR